MNKKYSDEYAIKKQSHTLKELLPVSDLEYFDTENGLEGFRDSTEKFCTFDYGGVDMTSANNIYTAALIRNKSVLHKEINEVKKLKEESLSYSLNNAHNAHNVESAIITDGKGNVTGTYRGFKYKRPILLMMGTGLLGSLVGCGVL